MTPKRSKTTGRFLKSSRRVRRNPEVKPHISRFTSYAAAQEASARRPGTQVLMGDHPYYWVVTNYDAGRLKKAGYESAGSLGLASLRRRP